MARLPRLVVPGQVHHLVHRTVNGTDAFPAPTDLRTFLEALQRSSREHRVAVHAYVLLPDEIQLLATPPTFESLGLMMQALARFYVPAFNRRHGRAGALWQGRFRAAPVGGADNLLMCMLYVEQASQRSVGGAGEAAAALGGANDALASSAAHHVGELIDPLLASVPTASAYWQLGNTPFEREAAYRKLLERLLADDSVHLVEASTLKGWALGPGEFLATLTASGARRPIVMARGRQRRG